MGLAMHIAVPARADWRAPLIALAAALLMLLQATWNNGFPAAFHPDESSKVGQILRGEYDFHHPLLMLRATQLLVDWDGAGDDPEHIVRTGRQVSALAAAGAVLCLVLVAALLAGNVAALAAGLLLVSNHALFELAHYFKEDTMLLFGIAAFLLALLLYQRAPTVGRAVLLGSVLGLAVSAKYTALILVPAAVLVIPLLAAGATRIRQLAGCFLAAASVALLVNWPALSQLATFRDSFVRELQLAAGGHQGIGRSVPHGYYIWLAWTSTNAVVWTLIALYLGGLWLRRRAVGLAEWMIAAFPFGFALLLSFFSQVSFRYYLPGTAVLLVLAALGAADLGRLRWAGRPLFAPVRSWQVTAAVVALAVAVQVPTLVAYHDGFVRDTRSRLADYLLEHVPPGTPLAEDNGVKLQAFDLPYPLQRSRFVADLGSLDELRAHGVRYVAVTRRRYGRLFLPNATANADADAARRRAFYQHLFAEGKLMFEAPQGPVKYLEPHLALYRLPDALPAADDGARISGAASNRMTAQ